MSDFNTVTVWSEGQAIPGGDLGVINAASNAQDIPAYTAVIPDATNPVSGTQGCYGVTFPTASGGAQGGGLGITLEDMPAGRTGRCRVYGVAPAISDGGCTINTRVRASDTAGKVGRVKTCAAGEAQLGQCLLTCLDGEMTLVLLGRSWNA